MKTTITVKRECNTFSFSVEQKNTYKAVIVVQHTDFSGTELEKDFPNGDTSIWTVKVSASLTDKEAINLAGSKLLETWEEI